MADDGKTTESRPVDTVRVAVIATGDASKMDSGVVAVTPGSHNPNLVTQVVTPLAAILVRFGYDWCQAFVGIVMAGGLLDQQQKFLPHTDYITLFKGAAFVATCVAFVGLVKNAATIFSGLEKRFPLQSGNV